MLLVVVKALGRVTYITVAPSNKATLFTKRCGQIREVAFGKREK